MDWPFADAKKRLGDVLIHALTGGPQRVTYKNEAVMVLSEAEFQRLGGHRPSFKEFLSDGPSFADLDLTRDPRPVLDDDENSG